MHLRAQMNDDVLIVYKSYGRRPRDELGEDRGQAEPRRSSSPLLFARPATLSQSSLKVPRSIMFWQFNPVKRWLKEDTVHNGLEELKHQSDPDFEGGLCAQR